ncbi:MAG: hypothetical protein ABEJ99_00680 [Candidatus Nanohaloarchaea archaeon]
MAARTHDSDAKSPDNAPMTDKERIIDVLEKLTDEDPEEVLSRAESQGDEVYLDNEVTLFHQYRGECFSDYLMFNDEVTANYDATLVVDGREFESYSGAVTENAHDIFP